MMIKSLNEKIKYNLKGSIYSTIYYLYRRNKNGQILNCNILDEMLWELEFKVEDRIKAYRKNVIKEQILQQLNK